MTADPEDVLDPEDMLEPAALPEQGSDDDETLDDAARGVSVTSDATVDSTGETGEIDAIGRAAGLVVRDDRPFRGIEEVERRDEHRWELDPASVEDASAAGDDPAGR